MATIGSRLRSAREERKLSLADVCRVTKVPVALLDAIERGDVPHLSSSIFGRGFVRAYALQVGIDPEQAVADYVAQFRVEPPVQESEPEPTPPAGDGRNLILLAGVVSAAFAIAIYSALSRSRTAPLSDQSAARDTHAARVSEPLSAAPAAASVASGMALHIESRGDCAVSATADGQSVLSRSLPAGERVSVQARDEITVRFNNPEMCAYWMDRSLNTERSRGGDTLTIRMSDGTEEAPPLPAGRAAIVSATRQTSNAAPAKKVRPAAIAPSVIRTSDPVVDTPLVTPVSEPPPAAAESSSPPDVPATGVAPAGASPQ